MTAITRWVYRYAHKDEPVPDGWVSRLCVGRHGAEGYVIWSRQVTNSRVKGASFERTCATKINQWFQDYTGYDIEVKRDLEQYRSGDHGDLIGLPGWTIECKRYNSNGSVFYRREWWEQVVTASLSNGTQPVLIYKYDRQPMCCVVFLSSISSNYVSKQSTAIISFDTWLMLAAESLVDSEL